MSKRWNFAYALLCHIVTLASLIYMALWLARVGVPKHVDSGTPRGLALSIVVDASLLGIYCFGHSYFARSRVKAALRRLVPHALERASYCLVFALGLIGLCLAWQPLPEIVWRIQSAAGVTLMWSLFASAWLLHFVAIFWIGYAEFFGLRQAWLAAEGRAYRAPPAQGRRAYAISHVLLIVSMMAIPGLTPVMSVGQLLFFVLLLVYDVIGAVLSSRDLGDVPAPTQ